jgi:hypothetical protein
MIDYHVEKKYELPKRFFGKFPSEKWDEMITDINNDIDYEEANAKIISFMTQLKPIFEGGNGYRIKIYKSCTPAYDNHVTVSTFNIEIYLDKQRIVEFDYFPLRSDGLPSIHDYYTFWIDSTLFNKQLLIKNLYHFNDDFKIEFVNHIFFNSGFTIDAVSERIITNVRTRIKVDGKTRDVADLNYDFESLCHDLVKEPKKVVHALYFRNNEVTYEDFIHNEKDSHALSAMIDI